MTAPTFFEVCAGCGGMSTGFLRAGFICRGVNEIDPVCCETLRLNHPSIPVYEYDMSKLVSNECRIDPPDVLVGGIPCQSFSYAGKRKGLDDPRGNLMNVFISLVHKWQPRVFVIENVKGLVSHEKGETLRRIIALLSQEGLYRIHHQVLNAWDYGVPQKRERVFIVGVRSDQGCAFRFPPKGSPRPVLRDILPLGIPYEHQSGTSYPERKKEIFRQIPPGGCWVDLPETLQRSYLGKSFESGGGKRGIARRLSLDEPCLTLTTSPCQKQTERCHPLEDRPFTVEEYAAIQTFPPDYRFAGSIVRRYRQIGNAVPCNLAHAVACAVRDTILSRDTDSTHIPV